MTSDWKEYKIGDLCSRVTSGGTPKSTNAEYYVGGTIPWLNTKEVRFNRIYLTEKFITELGLNNSSAKWITANNVIVAMYGATAGNVAINKIPLTTNQACCNLEIDATKADYNFIYYYLLKNYNVLSSMANGGAQQNLNSLQIKDFDILLPPLETQRKIAKVLGAIDDKIELNNSINKNLEQQMQSIFLELFPFIFNNANDTLEKIISFSNGKKRPENMGTIPVYGGNGILAYSDSSNSENCVIIGRVGAYCGNTFLCTGPCWVSDNAIQAKSKIGDSQLFIFYILKNAHLQSRHIGTGQPLMTQGILNSIPFNMPDISIIKQFTDNCEPMQKLIIDNTIENERLTQLRDTLLPKLMNGEIDVDKVNISTDKL